MIGCGSLNTRSRREAHKREIGVARRRMCVELKMHLMVGLQSSWKCVEISLQDGSVPVIGGVPLPDCNIEPAVWFKVVIGQ